MTRDKLRSIYDDDAKSYALRLEFAAMLDMRILVKTTYDLEGDRLEIMLTYDRIESLRAIGTSIGNKDDGVLPNVERVEKLGVGGAAYSESGSARSADAAEVSARFCHRPLVRPRNCSISASRSTPSSASGRGGGAELSSAARSHTGTSASAEPASSARSWSSCSTFSSCCIA